MRFFLAFAGKRKSLLRLRAKETLNLRRLLFKNKNILTKEICSISLKIFFPDNGAPGRIRTCDLRIRSPVLYPAELLAQCKRSDLYRKKPLCTSSFCFSTLARWLLGAGYLPPIAVHPLSARFRLEEIDLIFRGFHFHSGDNIDPGPVLDLQIRQFGTFFIEQVLGDING